MQTKKALEDWYSKKDPWSYEKVKDDQARKQNIINLANFFCPTGYERALDIGAGEGWVTKDLPAKEIHGCEISDTAAARFPEEVIRVIDPIGEYDLVLATGVLYPQYDWRKMLGMIRQHASSIVIVAGIVDWLVPEVASLGIPKMVETFKYRQFTQVINVFIASDRTN